MHPSERELTAAVTENPSTAPERRLQPQQLRIGALVAIVAAAAFIGWLVLRNGDDKAPTASGAETVSANGLESFAASVDHPVYWAGPRDAHSYEVTRTADGRVYVRYLPEGVEAGDPRPNFLTIGTYPRATAFAELRRASRARGADSLRLARGGLAVFSDAKPTSVYFGYPEARYQVEVYSPSGDEARRLVLAGQVVPVG
jgi:hypothetical protein